MSEYLAQIGSKGGEVKVQTGAPMISEKERKERQKQWRRLVGRANGG